jgi:hypothetical protein
MGHPPTRGLRRRDLLTSGAVSAALVPLAAGPAAAKTAPAHGPASLPLEPFRIDMQSSAGTAPQATPTPCTKPCPTPCRSGIGGTSGTTSPKPPA